MGKANALMNADRILGCIYTFEDPYALIKRMGEALEADDSDIYERFSFRLKLPTTKFEPTRDNSIRGRILRTYRERYPHDYSADQVNLQLNALNELIQRAGEGWDDLAYLYLLIAREVLTRENRQLEIRHDQLFNWNGYINKVDLNLIIGAYLAQYLDQHEANIEVDQYFPALDNERLESQLQELGLADNHAHLKAAGFVSELNWNGFLQAGFCDASLCQFVKDGALDDLNDRYSVSEQVKFLQSTKVLRILLDTYRPHMTNRYANPEQSMDEVRLHLFQCAVDAWAKSDDKYSEIPFSIWKQNHELVHDEDEVPFCLSVINEERLFLADCFRALIGEQRNSSFFKLVFNLYLMCSNRIKSAFIQDNRGNGFDHFTDAENIKSTFLSAAHINNQMNYESVFEKYTQRPSAKKVELRITPKTSVQEYASEVGALNTAKERIETYHGLLGDRLKTPSYGLIVHFIKFDHRQVRHSESREDTYRKFEIELKNQAQPLIALMTRTSYRSTAQKIVGIDTANLERHNPPEVFGNLYRMFKPIKRLGHFHFTYHVGESFDTLVDGMRHIFEVLWRLQFESGDRLGHALALGMDPEKFYQVQRNQIITEQQSLLDDFAWLYFMIQKFGDAEDFQLLTIIQNQFDEHVTWFNTAVDFQIRFKDYLDFYLLRGTDLSYLLKHVYGLQEPISSLNDIKSIDPQRRNTVLNDLDPSFIAVGNELVEQAVINVQAIRLYVAYMWNPQVYTEGTQTVQLTMNSVLLRVVKRAQRLLQKFVLAKGVAIEANPSSNLKIGYTRKYEELPMLALNRHGLRDNTTLDIPLSINTDDGAVFQTSLAYEYELIAQALIIGGESPESVYDYIGRLQTGSIRQSFVQASTLLHENEEKLEKTKVAK